MRPTATPSRSAFTLIELMIVIVVIGILIAILAPAGVPDREKVRVQKIMQSLDQALAAYSQTYDGLYPPSNNATIGSGAQCLYYYLMGPRGKGWDTDSPDGAVKPIYRFGAAKELEQEWMVGEQNGRKYYTDGDPSEPMPVLYWRANVIPDSQGIKPVAFDDVYSMADNSRFWSPSAADWQKLIVDPGSRASAPYNARSYLLWTAGKDRQFGIVTGVCDDLMNFRRKN